MAETIVLQSPEVAPSQTTTEYRIASLLLEPERHPIARIVVTLRGTNGERKRIVYQDPTTLTMIRALNRANLSVKSLERRILERLIADGHLVGAVAGDAD